MGCVAEQSQAAGVPARTVDAADGIDQIARLLLTEPTVAQRIVRTKRKIPDAGIRLRVPDPDERPSGWPGDPRGPHRELRPQQLAPAAHRAGMLAQDGRREDAVAAYREALALEPAPPVRQHIANQMAALRGPPQRAEET